MGLNEAKYPEQEMTEILKRVSKIEGPEIARRRMWNFARNTVLLVAIPGTPVFLAWAAVIRYANLSVEIPDDLD